MTTNNPYEHASDERWGRDGSQDTSKLVARRDFLTTARTIGVGGAVAAYAAPQIAVAQGAGGLSPATFFNCAEVPTMERRLAEVVFSDSAEANLDALAAIAEQWQAGGAESLSAQDVAEFFELGWLVSFEVSAEAALHEAVNITINMPSNAPWPMTPDNQGEFMPASINASQAELASFDADCGVAQMTPAGAAVIGAALVSLLAEPI